jgi:hypothetical protein
MDNLLEIIATFTAGAVDPASIGRGTDKSKPSKADMAFVLKGLSELQTHIIMAKYASCTHARLRLTQAWAQQVLEIACERGFSKRGSRRLLPLALATLDEGLSGRKFSPAERGRALGWRGNTGSSRLVRYQEIMDSFIAVEQAAVEQLGRNIRGR